MQFDGRVAATVQNELRVLAEQSRRVDAQREVGRNPAAHVASHEILRLGLDEAAIHALSLERSASVPR